MDTETVIQILVGKAREAGSQKKLADQFGISQQFLSDVLLGRKNPGDSILRHLGLKRAPLNYIPLNDPPQERVSGQESEGTEREETRAPIQKDCG